MYTIIKTRMGNVQMINRPVNILNICILCSAGVANACLPRVPALAGGAV